VYPVDQPGYTVESQVAARKQEPAMSYPDALIQAALDRQAELVRAVQACGVPQNEPLAVVSWAVDEAGSKRRSLGRAGRGLAAATVVVGLLALIARHGK
jgi:anti-sigma factor RsiW